LEKQKLRFMYRLSEKQFKRLFQRAKTQGGRAGDNLLCLLERRLDNVVYRGQLAKTRAQARQLVSHGHITVNGRKSKTPALQVRPGDVVQVRPESAGRPYFQNLRASGLLEMEHGLAWLETAPEELKVTVVEHPDPENGEQVADLQAIVEFYSR
jgi:small subunit ribosomal protein S4